MALCSASNECQRCQNSRLQSKTFGLRRAWPPPNCALRFLSRANTRDKDKHALER
ncbi:BZ3500_MvSof-1268-A1-R1_Chr2-3g05276 [Microbotryum saponariae]|uniref:BZ3500_MvSof-1268-A1-R1_Chr2-3g05276 protein n=1 Tax=Microbotryum saponariae TaxID=289078 RepID=A0A2X0K961_9BASI|nr:BZ3500_MvSof-1268-A1-R1_Chr2-3g05276 [Microbotryum saponariae]SDA01102.1 BZ3501_MvSof-1269-A2-R1_Chr2-2g04949 [Microbotryum saponariae]